MVFCLLFFGGGDPVPAVLPRGVFLLFSPFLRGSGWVLRLRAKKNAKATIGNPEKSTPLGSREKNIENVENFLRMLPNCDL